MWQQIVRAQIMGTYFNLAGNYLSNVLISNFICNGNSLDAHYCNFSMMKKKRAHIGPSVIYLEPGIRHILSDATCDGVSTRDTKVK
jgi:hypothetical protein